jgi:hypothetical protein
MFIFGYRMSPFNYQFLKDFLAVPIFILIALDVDIHASRSLLSLFFSLGCLTDTVFSCYSYIHDSPWTIARVKDGLGAVGMWVFTICLSLAGELETTNLWPYFFYFAASVDICSVFSVLFQNNVYTFRLFPRKPV